jgi:hypothetical protein
MEEGKLKKTIVIAIAALIINILIIETVNANECWRIERQLNEANYKLRQGGNASYMKMWRQSRDHNAEELPKCRKRFGDGDPSISVANGQNSQSYGYRNEQLIDYKTDNPQLQKVISTCNYWIQQNNQYATENTRVMRNTACENYNRTIRDLEKIKNNPPQEFRTMRSLKECVKPNNNIDDVKRCMQGLREPDWLVTKANH